MTAPSDTIRPEDLLAEYQWLRRLARCMVSDHHLAEDAVQETCVSALKSAPNDRSRLRQWLSSILRNFVRQHARKEQARVARESEVTEASGASGGSGAGPNSTLDLVERVSIQQKVVAIVLQLDAAHRSVLLLRYFEDLPPREIAARLKLPVSTVNSRLTRGMQKVRGQMDREFDGDRRAWLSVILPAMPAIQPTLTATVSALGVLLMQSKLQVAAAALLLTGLVYVCWPDASPAQAEPTPDGNKVVLSNTPSASAPGERTSASLDRRSLAPGEKPEDPPSENGDAASAIARGLVLWSDGRPAVDVAVGFDGTGAESAVRSKHDGRFAIPIGSGGGHLVAKDQGVVTVLSGAASANASFETVLVIARPMRIGGQVVSTAGQAIADAKIEIRLPDDFESRLNHVLDRSRRVSWRATSGADGRFSVMGVPAIDGLHLAANRAPFRPRSKTLAGHPDLGVYLVLGEVKAEDGPAILGRVVDGDGVAVADAQVASGLTMTVSDANGNFRVLCKRAGKPESIRAIKAGYAMARFTPSAVGAVRGEPQWPDFVELRITRDTLSISGRVLDVDGKPIRGALVWTPDATTFGIHGAAPVSVEYLSAGGEMPRRKSMPADVLDNPLKGDNTSGGMWRAKLASAHWFFTQTDEDGRFTLTGLADKRYRVRAMRKQTVLMATSTPTQAGSTGLDIRMAKEDVHQLVAGTMVLADGSPASGVSISVFCNVRDIEARIPGGRFRGELIRHGRRTKTDAEGHFRLEGTPAQGVRLSIYGDHIIPRFYRLRDDEDVANLRIPVTARYHLQVSLVATGSADSIRGEDAQGKRTLFTAIRSGSMSQRPEIQLIRGRSAVLVVPSRLRILVFLKDGNEVGRHPVKLKFGETCRVRF